MGINHKGGNYRTRNNSFGSTRQHIWNLHGNSIVPLCKEERRKTKTITEVGNVPELDNS